MRNFITILMAATCAAITATATNYSTEATMTRQKDKGTYEVIVRVSRLIEQNGAVIEQMIDQPKIISAPGMPASIRSDPPSGNSADPKKETVSVDVSWPEVGKRDFAVCTVTVKLGNQIVSKTRTKVMVEEK